MRKRKVVMVDRSMNVKFIYETIKEAAQSSGYPYNYVYQRVSGQIMPHSEFNNDDHITFRFIDDEEVNLPEELNPRDYVINHTSERMLMILIMEECGETIQACAKRLRADDPEGCTPVTRQKAMSMFNEETGDLLLLLEIAGVVPDGTTKDNPKWERMYQRIMEVAEHGNEVASVGV